MVVGIEVRSENSSLLTGRARTRVPSTKASRILVPVVLSLFAVTLVAFSYSLTTQNPNAQLLEASSVGEKVLKAITHVAAKSGKLHSEASSLQSTDDVIRQTLAHDKVDAAADDHAIHKFSEDLKLKSPLLAADQTVVARLQASIKAADLKIAVAKKAMIIAEASEAVAKKKYLAAAAPWQKVQAQEASAQKKYRADEELLKKLVKKAAADSTDTYAAEKLAAVEKKLHNDRKAARSGSVDIDKLGVVADQEALVNNVNKAEAETSTESGKYTDLMSKRAALSDRLVAEKNRVANEKAQVASDKRMLAHFKTLLAAIGAQEKRETSLKLKVMARINELVAIAPTDSKAATAKSSSAKK